MAEWRIGEIKQVNGEWYQCIESHSSCEGCDFKNTFKCSYAGTKCSFPVRQDHTSVIFKKLEKVGEPYMTGNKLIQLYKIYPTTYCIKVYGWYYQNLDVKSWTIGIEIKQNKEDMEEKKFCEETSKANEVNMIFKIASKYINGGITYDEFGEAMRNWINGSEKDEHILKEFDLEAAKQGKPVCTRDGRKARIICFDKKCLDEQILIVLVDCGKEESIYFYTTDGKCIDDFSSFDLMMFPEKKEGWIVIHKEAIYDKETAEKIARETTADVIRIQKIEWEE